MIRTRASASLTRKILSTGALRLLIIPLSFLCSMVGNAMVMRSVGIKSFGVISLITSLPNLVPFMDLGLGTSLINAFASFPRERALRQARIAWSMLWVVAVVLFGICVALQFTIGWNHILGIDLSPFRWWGLTLFFLSTFVSIPFGIGQRMLVGMNMVPLVTTVGILAPVTTLGLLAVGKFLSTPELFLAASAIAQLVVAMAMLFIATRNVGIPQRSWFAFTLGESHHRREIASAAGPMMVITAGLPLALETHRLVLARQAPEQLGTYSVAMVLYAPVFGIIVQMASNLWPFFSNSRAQEGANSARRRYWRLQAYAVPLALIYSAGFVVCAPFVNMAWSKQAVPTRIWIGLGTLLFLQIVQYVPGMYMTTARGLRLQAMCVVGMCAITLVVMLSTTHRFGAMGPITGSVCGVLLAQLIPEWILIARHKEDIYTPRRMQRAETSR